MMDQILAGVSQVSPPVQPAYRDQSSSAGAENGDSFQDCVSKAGQQESHHQRRDDRDRRVDDNASNTGTAADAARTIAVATTDIARNAADSAESRIRLALLKQGQKAATPAETGKDVDAEKALVKILDPARKSSHQATRDTTATPMAQDEVTTPSEELSLLLGLKPGKDVARSNGKHQVDRDADKAETKDEKTALRAEQRAEIVLTGADSTAPSKAGKDNARNRDGAVDEAVRLVSADGKGRPVDISLKTGTDGATDPEKRSNPAKIDTATVIEARRYLGFSGETNATNLTGAIKSDVTWTEALSHVNRTELALEGDTVTEVNTLKLQMSPGDLGNMVASLKLKGDELTVEVRVDTIEAYRQLSADQDGIVKALQDQGFSIDTVTVQLNQTDRTEPGPDREPTRQQQRDAEGKQPDGRNNNARQGAQHSWTRNDDAGTSSASDSRTDPSRTGNIYL